MFINQSFSLFLFNIFKGMLLFIKVSGGTIYPF